MEISNGNTSPALATAGVNEDNGVKYYGRTAPNDVQQALVVARVLNQIIGADTASFLYVDNPYGQGLAEAASEAFSGETLNMVAYTQATNDYTSTLDAVFDGEPDAIGAVMYPGNGRTILRQWSQGGYGGQWVGAEAIWSPQMLSDLSDIVEGMYITSPQTANSETFQENMGGTDQITQFAPTRMMAHISWVLPWRKPVRRVEQQSLRTFGVYHDRMMVTRRYRSQNLTLARRHSVVAM